MELPVHESEEFKDKVYSLSKSKQREYSEYIEEAISEIHVLEILLQRKGLRPRLPLTSFETME